MTPADQLWPTPGPENAFNCWRISARHHTAKPPCLNYAGARQTVSALFHRTVSNIKFIMRGRSAVDRLVHTQEDGGAITSPATSFQGHDITEPWPALRKIDVLRCCLFLPRGSDTDGRRSSTLLPSAG